MICIGSILKSHKTEGEFLCRLYNPLLPDENGQHRLSELWQIEIRRPTRKTLKTQKPATRGQVVPKTLLLTKLSLRAETTLLLKSQEWKQPEEIHPYHGWEIWVDRAYASPCAAGEFLYSDLIGAQLYYKNSSGERQILGTVHGLMEGAAQLLLEISGTEKHSYLPFHQSIIGDIDTSTSPVQIEVLDLEYFQALL